MPETGSPSSPSETSSRAFEFVTRWAEYTRAFAFYPVTNPRVVVAERSLFALLPGALREVDPEPDAGLRVLFASEAFAVGAVEHPIPPTSPIRWLGERVHRAALAGVAFLSTVRSESLRTFTQQLVEYSARTARNQSFEELWPEVYPGLRLLDRRFEGYFDQTAAREETRRRVRGAGGGGAGTGRNPKQEIAALVSLHPTIREQMARLRMLLDSEGREGESSQRLDVLGRIVDLLPHDAFKSYDQAAGIVGSVLHEFETRLGQVTGEDRHPLHATETLLNQIIMATSGGILGGRAPSAGELADRLRRDLEGTEILANDVDDAPAVACRADDSGVIESLFGLRNDLADLPRPFDGTLTAGNVESADEQLGVYLHMLVQHEDEELAPAPRAHLVSLLQHADAARLAMLRTYLEESARRDGPGFKRIVSLLRAHDLDDLLRSSDYLTPDVVIEQFPLHFGLYLESLDPESAHHRSELGKVLVQVGSERIRASVDTLVEQEGVLDEPRVRLLVSEPSPAFLPVLRLVLLRGSDALRARAVATLRAMRWDLREAGLLYIWEDPAGLPLPYLLTIADPDRTEEHLASIRPLISLQIVRYLEATPPSTDAERHRIHAIRQLGTYFSVKAEALLERILTARRFGFAHTESKAVREAARRSLELGRRAAKEGPSRV